MIVARLDRLGIRADILGADVIDAPSLIQIVVRRRDFDRANEAWARLRQQPATLTSDEAA